MLKVKILIFRIACRLLGYQYRTATTKEEVEKVYRLRDLVYREFSYEEGKTKDEFDEYSDYVFIEKNNEVVGAVRIIKNSFLGLPIEKFFNVKLNEGEYLRNVCEVSRLTIKSQYRGGLRLVGIGILIGILEYLKNSNTKVVYFTSHSKIINSYRKLGIPIMKLAHKKDTDQNILNKLNHRSYFSRHEVQPYVIKVNDIKI